MGKPFDSCGAASCSRYRGMRLASRHRSHGPQGRSKRCVVKPRAHMLSVIERDPNPVVSHAAHRIAGPVCLSCLISRSSAEAGSLRNSSPFDRRWARSAGTSHAPYGSVRRRRDPRKPGSECTIPATARKVHSDPSSGAGGRCHCLQTSIGMARILAAGQQTLGYAGLHAGVGSSGTVLRGEQRWMRMYSNCLQVSS